MFVLLRLGFNGLFHIGPPNREPLVFFFFCRINRKRRRSQSHDFNTPAATPALNSGEPVNVDEEKTINQNPTEVASTIEVETLLCQEELDLALNEDPDLVCEERAESHQLDEGRSNPIVSSMDIDEDDATGTEKVYIPVLACFFTYTIWLTPLASLWDSFNSHTRAYVSNSYRTLDLARATGLLINLIGVTK